MEISPSAVCRLLLRALPDTFTKGRGIGQCGGITKTLSRQYLTPYLRLSGRVQPLFLFDRDRSGRRQLLYLCSPLQGKASVADLEDDPLADYIVSGGPLRKLDDAALHRMWFSVRRTGTRTWSAFLGCELPHCYWAEILAFSYSRHRPQRYHQACNRDHRLFIDGMAGAKARR